MRRSVLSVVVLAARAAGGALIALSLCVEGCAASSPGVSPPPRGHVVAAAGSTAPPPPPPPSPPLDTPCVDPAAAPSPPSPVTPDSGAKNAPPAGPVVPSLASSEPVRKGTTILAEILPQWPDTGRYYKSSALPAEVTGLLFFSEPLQVGSISESYSHRAPFTHFATVYRLYGGDFMSWIPYFEGSAVLTSGVVNWVNTPEGRCTTRSDAISSRAPGPWSPMKEAHILRARVDGGRGSAAATDRVVLDNVVILDGTKGFIPNPTDAIRSFLAPLWSQGSPEFKAVTAALDEAVARAEASDPDIAKRKGLPVTDEVMHAVLLSYLDEARSIHIVYHAYHKRVYKEPTTTIGPSTLTSGPGCPPGAPCALSRYQTMKGGDAHEYGGELVLVADIDKTGKRLPVTVYKPRPWVQTEAKGTRTERVTGQSSD